MNAENHETAIPPVLSVESYQAPLPPANDPYQTTREQLRASTLASQLFITPRDLAARVVDLAYIRSGDRLLEPEAGTGRLIDAAIGHGLVGEIVAVESNPALASALLAKYGERVKVRHADFLECRDEIGYFHRIIMHPPWNGFDDIAHVLHAARFLQTGGRLVALMSDRIVSDDSRTVADFRGFVERRAGSIERIPDDPHRAIAWFGA